MRRPTVCLHSCAPPIPIRCARLRLLASQGVVNSISLRHQQEQRDHEQRHVYG